MAQSRFTTADRGGGTAESRPTLTGQVARVPILQFVPSGPDGGPKFKSGGPILSFDRFEEELRNRLDGNCAGYSFAFNLNGNLERSGAWGMRQNATDSPNGNPLPQSEFERMHIASVAKNITASAVIRLLAMSGVSLNESIADYMPTLWDVNDDFQDVKFHHLLIHRSGFNTFGASTTYSSLQNSVANGTDTGVANTGAYDNRNFGLLRIALPYAVCPQVMMQHEIDGFFSNSYDETVDDKTSELFVWLCNEYVLEPAGILGAECRADSSDAWRTMFYDGFGDTNPGQDGGDWTNRSGGAGWVLSAVELAQYMAFRRYSNVILSEGQREMMDTEGYGWQTTVGEHGTYLRHGGAFDASGPLRAQIMQFPNCNVEAVLLVNSDLQGTTVAAALRDAFDAAWE